MEEGLATKKFNRFTMTPSPQNAAQDGHRTAWGVTDPQGVYTKRPNIRFQTQPPGFQVHRFPTHPPGPPVGSAPRLGNPQFIAPRPVRPISDAEFVPTTFSPLHPIGTMTPKPHGKSAAGSAVQKDAKNVQPWMNWLAKDGKQSSSSANSNTDAWRKWSQNRESNDNNVLRNR